LTDYPRELNQARYSEGSECDGPKDFELLSTCKKIQELNHWFRKHWSESDYAEVAFPDSYLLVGDDGCGNLYAIDTAKTNGPVFEFDHEVSEWSNRARSLEEFGRQLLEMAAELRRRQR
jgi:hypothetical protein